MRYKVELTKSDEGYAVRCPELPGCWSKGETEDEALTNIQSAISDYLETRSPSPARRHIRFVDVAAPAKPAAPEPFTVQPFLGLEWPEEFNNTDKVSDWVAYLDRQEQGTACS